MRLERLFLTLILMEVSKGVALRMGVTCREILGYEVALGLGFLAYWWRVIDGSTRYFIP